MNIRNFSPIVLLTDFGHEDSFSGILKGVIAGISPTCNVIDLSHGIKPQNILQAAFLLYTSYLYFPPKSVFCVVVDPGVGSVRKPICIETTHYYFVGPDNGVLWLAANHDGIKQIIHLTQAEYFLDTISSTFHGRDIFAPVCAHITNKLENLSLLGEPIDQAVRYDFPKVKKFNSHMELTIINIDRFGNITLNITEKKFTQFIQSSSFSLNFSDVVVSKVHQNYSQALGDEPFLIGSSSSYMEIAIKNGNAAEKFHASCLDNILLKRHDPASLS